MDKEEIDNIMQKLLKLIESFNEEKTYDKALHLDQSITILRFIIGEQNFMPLHYFRAAHEDAVKYIDEYRNARDKVNTENNIDKGNDK